MRASIEKKKEHVHEYDLKVCTLCVCWRNDHNLYFWFFIMHECIRQIIARNVSSLCLLKFRLKSRNFTKLDIHFLIRNNIAVYSSVLIMCTLSQVQSEHIQY